MPGLDDDAIHLDARCFDARGFGLGEWGQSLHRDQFCQNPYRVTLRIDSVAGCLTGSHRDSPWRRLWKTGCHVSAFRSLGLIFFQLYRR